MLKISLVKGWKTSFASARWARRRRGTRERKNDSGGSGGILSYINVGSCFSRLFYNAYFYTSTAARWKNWNYSAGSTFSFVRNFWFFRWASTFVEIWRFRGDELARKTFQQFSHWARCVNYFHLKACDFFFPTRWVAWWTSIFFWESINRITH